MRPAWLTLTLALGLAAGACFNAPRPAVQFSCDPVEAPECPEDYTCEADGCCHLVGSDFQTHAGECQLGGVLPTAGPPATSTSGTDDTTGGTQSGTASSGSSGSSDTSADSTTADPTTSDSTTTGPTRGSSGSSGASGSSGSESGAVSSSSSDGTPTTTGSTG